MMQVTKTIEFDAGHRLPNHGSKCRNLHGHRYRLEVSLTGPVQETSGNSSDGMVVDFADIKKIANDLIEQMDHAFIVYQDDTEMLDFLASTGSKHYVLDSMPTCENISKHIYDILGPQYRQSFGTDLALSKIKLYETPNSFTEYPVS